MSSLAFVSLCNSDAVARAAVEVEANLCSFIAALATLVQFCWCPALPIDSHKPGLLDFGTLWAMDDLKVTLDTMQITQKCLGPSISVCWQELIHLSYCSPGLTWEVAVSCLGTLVLETWEP